MFRILKLPTRGDSTYAQIVCLEKMSYLDQF